MPRNKYKDEVFDWVLSKPDYVFTVREMCKEVGVPRTPAYYFLGVMRESLSTVKCIGRGRWVYDTKDVYTDGDTAASAIAAIRKKRGDAIPMQELMQTLAIADSRTLQAQLRYMREKGYKVRIVKCVVFEE